VDLGLIYGETKLALKLNGYRNRIAVDIIDSSRCNCGAISLEKMDFMDSMDAFELIPSREKTEIAPINPVYKHHIGFEVGRQI